MREVSEAARRMRGRLPEDQVQLGHGAGHHRALPGRAALLGEVCLNPSDRAPCQVANHLITAIALGPVGFSNSTIGGHQHFPQA